jgi:hypothetical protein
MFVMIFVLLEEQSCIDKLSAAAPLGRRQLSRVRAIEDRVLFWHINSSGLVDGRNSRTIGVSSPKSLQDRCMIWAADGGGVVVQGHLNQLGGSVVVRPRPNLK